MKGDPHIEWHIVARDILKKTGEELTQDDWQRCRYWVALRRLEQDAAKGALD